MSRQAERVGPVAIRSPIERVRAAVEGARSALFAAQHDDGHWCAELEGDTILESEYVLCLYFLGRGGEDRARRAANALRHRQLPEGGWAIYPDGPAEVSASVKAYLVLKLVGDDPQAPHMVRARERILALGGVDACNSFTKIYLSIFRQYDWSSCPAVPPEMMLLPRWLYFNIYAMSSWSRAIVVPLSIIWAHKPTSVLPEHATIDELKRPGGPGPEHPAVDSWTGRLWGLLFRAVNRANLAFEGSRIRPFRRRALRRAERWILARLEKSDGLGAIFPPIINTLIAFRCLGYPIDHPVIRQQMRELEKLEIDDGDELRIQPCFSPVWDTVLTVNALLEAGVPPDDPRLLSAGRWLLAHEVRQPGDWCEAAPDAPVGGWYFEYANEFYPDCDDTAEVLKALAGLRFPDPAEETAKRAALTRGERWLRGMQNDDGGWAAFDRGCDKALLTYIPFADHNAMIDPSTTDITSRCIEALTGLGEDPRSPAVARASRFVLGMQEEDGSWYGRWGCNYLYGTWLALQGLRSAGVPAETPAVRRAVAWLESCQNADGGWGELPLSYDDPAAKGCGASTPSQTAWALLGLIAAEEWGSQAVRSGVDYLLREQRAGGRWVDSHWTGTGFPKVFYLKYHDYATYFPLQALAAYAWRVAGSEASVGAA